MTGGTYYDDDVAMQTAVSEHTAEATESFYDTVISYAQNYIVPADLFRYCSEKNTLSGVLGSLTYYRHYLVQDQTTGYYTIITDYNTIEGMTGRIPPKLFDDLVSSTTFDGVFDGLMCSPYIGYRHTEGIRG